MASQVSDVGTDYKNKLLSNEHVAKVELSSSWMCLSALLFYAAQMILNFNVVNDLFG